MMNDKWWSSHLYNLNKINKQLNKQSNKQNQKQNWTSKILLDWNLKHKMFQMKILFDINIQF